MARRLTPRGKERREQLMEVATRLFAQKGYHRTSVADVCDTCGVGKGVFYWYFDSKEALFNAILAGALHDLRRTQQRAIEPSPDPIERVTAGIEASLDFLAANDDLFNLIDFAGTDAHFSPVVRHGIDVVVDDTTRHLKEAIAQGAIPDADPYFLAHGITTITLTFVRRFLHRGSAEGTVDAVAVGRAAVAFCLHGIGLAAED
ncbi:MAG: TetR/AcrR family transcriptional regulator [Acidimicrobiia bacterium]|nr:TetR/AcrR family transcriptional regulator [Acidimicrobiia bacterium]